MHGLTWHVACCIADLHIIFVTFIDRNNTFYPFLACLFDFIRIDIGWVNNLYLLQFPPRSKDHFCYMIGMQLNFCDLHEPRICVGLPFLTSHPISSYRWKNSLDINEITESDMALIINVWFLPGEEKIKWTILMGCVCTCVYVCHMYAMRRNSKLSNS